MKIFTTLFFSTSLFVGLSAWAAKSPPPIAKAKLEAKSGSKVKGEVVFTPTKDGLEVAIDLKGATPGQHGFHIHEIPNCSSADAKTAGDHFNPFQEEHGDLHAAVRHVGDMGNIEVNAKGKCKTKVLIPTPTSKTFANWSIIFDKSIILHADPDDLKTQPSGNSGSRIACGVIKPVKKVTNPSPR